ncbi:MAG TPA: sigma-70 family RNA polymerase sigma factor [Gemmatimonadaceae bacterium]|nr:sigma-70 family RNA polymerase sigma factor [Gemmatimonadaceae bacterium]
MATQDDADPHNQIANAQRGDDQAFAALYRAHSGRVHGLALRLTGDPVAAQELMQDVFVRAWERLATFRGESALSSWLHRLTVNLALTTRRAEVRRLRRVGDEAEMPLDGGAAPVISHGDIDLERAIAALPAGARTVFVLHEIEGYSHEEIGRATGIAIGTSKAQLFRARRLLREALET